MANADSGQFLMLTMWADQESLEAERVADGIERTEVAERVGLRILVTQTMEVMAAHPEDPDGAVAPRWMRATWVEGVDSVHLDRLPELHHETVPALTDSGGFRGSYWLADRGTGNGVALSFWDGAADLTRSHGISHRRRRELARLLGFEVTPVSQYQGLAMALAPVVVRVPAY